MRVFVPDGILRLRKVARFEETVAQRLQNWFRYNSFRYIFPGMSAGSGFSLSGRPLGYNRVMIIAGPADF